MSKAGATARTCWLPPGSYTREDALMLRALGIVEAEDRQKGLRIKVRTARTPAQRKVAA